MRYRKLFIRGFWLLCTGILFLVAYHFLFRLGSVEFDNKSAYAYLQRIELAHRYDKKRYAHIFVDEPNLGGYSAVGLLAQGGEYSYVWILLNRSVNGKPILIPENLIFYVKCRDLILINRKKYRQRCNYFFIREMFFIAMRVVKYFLGTLTTASIATWTTDRVAVYFDGAP